LGHHSGVEKESDRHRAITRAVNAAAVADVILIAGKGHETTQEIHGARLPFSDLEHARSALRARWAGAPSC
jgi:UDP-N-acetylmuramoyl-L-alanyl-D-glutamate--2,6-diaminopimelate ligase